MFLSSVGKGLARWGFLLLDLLGHSGDLIAPISGGGLLRKELFVQCLRILLGLQEAGEARLQDFRVALIQRAIVLYGGLLQGEELVDGLLEAVHAVAEEVALTRQVGDLSIGFGEMFLQL